MSSRLSDDLHAGSQPVSSLIAAGAPRLRVSNPAQDSPHAPTASDPNSNAHVMALEIQNRELRAALSKAVQQRSRYFELFESSPIAYFIFDERHHLHDLNLAAGLLLPGERSKLKHRPFFPHLPDSDRTRFHRHLTEVLRDRTQISISLKLINNGPKPKVYRFLSQTAPSSPGEPTMVVSAVLEESAPAETAAIQAPLPDRETVVASYPGSGNTAQVFLPSSASALHEAGAQAGTHPTGSSGQDAGRILLVDDEAGVRMIIARMLESLGYVVEEAANGTEALSRFAQGPHRYCCVVSDMNMPGMDGLFLAQELKRQNPGIGCVIMSGLCEMASDSSSQGDPRVIFLQKPFTMPCLEDALMKASPPSLAPFLPSDIRSSGSRSRPAH